MWRRITKRQLVNNHARRIWSAGVLAVGIACAAHASAITPVSQSYLTSDKLSTGSVVSLKQDTTDYVNAATPSNVSNLFGVVVNTQNSLLSISSDQAHQVQVATSGIVDVSVSDINGSVNAGDEITASPISGVGMKATENIKVIGIAQDNLTNRNANSTTYTDKQGAKHKVLLGQIPVLINVSYFYKQPNKTIIPQAVQNIANALAGKPVNPLPILISMGIFLVTLIVVVSIIYSMIHGSIISVGRNPMSQSAIYRNVIQLSALVLGILGVAFVAMYMIITRF